MSLNKVLSTPFDFDYNSYKKLEVKDMIKIFNKSQYKQLCHELWEKILSMIKEIWLYRMEKRNSNGRTITLSSIDCPFYFCQKHSDKLGFFHNNKWENKKSPEFLMRQIIRLYHDEYLLVSRKEKIPYTNCLYTYEVLEHLPIMEINTWDNYLSKVSVFSFKEIISNLELRFYKTFIF